MKEYLAIQVHLSSSVYQVFRTSQGFSRVKGVSKSRKPGRVGSLHFKISRVGSGRVGSRGFQNLAGRVGSCPARCGSLAGQAIMTRELFSADPRVKPADLARGSAVVKLATAEDHCRAGAPRVGPADP